jgi:hypothetical protein
MDTPNCEDYGFHFALSFETEPHCKSNVSQNPCAHFGEEGLPSGVRRRCAHLSQFLVHTIHELSKFGLQFVNASEPLDDGYDKESQDYWAHSFHPVKPDGYGGFLSIVGTRIECLVGLCPDILLCLAASPGAEWQRGWASEFVGLLLEGISGPGPQLYSRHVDWLSKRPLIFSA